MLVSMLLGPVLAGTCGPAAGAAGGPSRPQVQAFLLAGAPDSFADLQKHAGTIDVLYPTFFECADGGESISREVEPQVTSFARAEGTVVLPRFNCQAGATVHAILTDPSLRSRTLQGLERIAANSSYAGIDLDLENDGAADREALTSFVGDLAEHLHALGKKLAVDVVGVTEDDPAIATGFYDDEALAAEADIVFVVAWGTHWAGSAPGPIAPLSFVEGVAHYVSSLPHAKRFVLGVPMYGLDWTEGSSTAEPAAAYQYSEIVALARKVGAVPQRDRSSDELTFAYTRGGLTHRVWYMDAKAIEDRLRVGRELGLGVGLWRLGREPQALWSSPVVR